MPDFLSELVALVVIAALVAYISKRLGLVPIVGFLAAGVLIGPNAFGLVQDQALVDAAAEIGVLLLLFTIGIEFSLEKLARIQRLIIGGGGLQVAGTTGVVVAVLMVFGVTWQAAVFTGFLVALSSTAIVLKLLADRGETGTEARAVGGGASDFPGHRHYRDGAADPDAGRRGRRGRRHRVGAGQGGARDRRGDRGGAAPDAARAGGRRQGVLERGVPHHHRRHLLRDGLPRGARGHLDRARRLSGGPRGERVEVLGARLWRDPAAPDPVLGHVLRVGGDAAGRGLSGRQPARWCWAWWRRCWCSRRS